MIVSEEMVTLLLGEGAGIQAQTEDGWTALHRASKYGHEIGARWLLNAGPDTLAETSGGSTALHLGARV